jgi:hypothetical protein
MGSSEGEGASERTQAQVATAGERGSAPHLASAILDLPWTICWYRSSLAINRFNNVVALDQRPDSFIKKDEKGSLIDRRNLDSLNIERNRWRVGV